MKGWCCGGCVERIESPEQPFVRKRVHGYDQKMRGGPTFAIPAASPWMRTRRHCRKEISRMQVWVSRFFVCGTCKPRYWRPRFLKWFPHYISDLRFSLRFFVCLPLQTTLNRQFITSCVNQGNNPCLLSVLSIIISYYFSIIVTDCLFGVLNYDELKWSYRSA